MLKVRRRIDIFFKYLFRVVSGFSILALGAILIFVFIQGAEPFLFPTASGIQMVTEGIDEITVNGETYRDARLIDIPRDTEELSVRFTRGERVEALRLSIREDAGEREEKLLFSGSEDGKLSYPEEYVYTLSYAGSMPGLGQKIHIILPEPRYSLSRFLGGLDWRPTYNKIYGILPMILGTILASFGAILLGVPIALLCSLFMAEFLPERPAALARSGIELLAGIPSVVYGFFGLMVVVPRVKNIFRVPSGNGLLSAILILAIMILPTVITIAETSMRAVPQSYREASLSLGASRMQTAWKVVLPHARSGVITGIILGISRAVGETMAVILVAGNSAQLIHSPLDSVRTLTATIALEMGYAQGRHSQILFSIGVTLFILILLLNSIILWFRHIRGGEFEG
ncbi:MAG: phosphate ABC transporter permease subunit PstC [Treponema sp.]|jgi:phosphate transport system permease protein|nr:phosphate ABC transporter permease subunit PstC [Treponema sp.]